MLQQPVEDVPFRLVPLAGVAPRQPDVAPDESGARRQVDLRVLEKATAAVRDRRPRQHDEFGAVLDRDSPLLRRVARQRWVDAVGRLTSDYGPRPRARHYLDQVPVA